MILIEPVALRAHFEQLLGCYRISEGGLSLLDLLRSDWSLFDGDRLANDEALSLLRDIFDDDAPLHHRFKARNSERLPLLQNWEDLRLEIMHRNRWVLSRPIDPEEFLEFLNYLVVSSKEVAPGRLWYRARVRGSQVSPFELKEMSAPPKYLATNGRVNPAGISYLYLASDLETAVAEVRPHTGATIQVAKFELSEAKLCDLRNPRNSVSPFSVADDGALVRIREALPILERLGRELASPVEPESADFAYTPSQYLCELIKFVGFDGVLYSSSVASGVNVALFDPELACARTMETHEVRKVEVKTSVLQVL